MANIILNGLTKSKRPIDRIFLHCSATPEDRDVSADDIRQWHKNKGWRDIGYHYVVRLDGTLEEGRSVNLDGAHARGYNQGSIAVCYIGGLNKDFDPKDTRTEPQLYALYNLLLGLTEIYPKATLHGHNEFSSKACPSFNVQEQYSSLINKTTEIMIDDFQTDVQDHEEGADSFADFVNDLTEDKANDNAVCGIDDDDCEACGA